MATSPSAASSERSHSASRPTSLFDQPVDDDDVDYASSPVPVETLVEHLLAAKRALSSMTLVLRGNELATHARHLHEESVILAAQAAFLRRGINEQVRLLLRVRRGMGRAYDGGKKDFKKLIQMLDAADGRLEQTMEMLRGTIVEAIFRPAGEEPRNLMDFVDEKSVEAMRNALKENIAELQAAQTSFDGDLLRFDTDLRSLKKTMESAPSPLSGSDAHNYRPIPHLISSLTGHSHQLAEHLTSLTHHFDMCVTAVRTTEGGTALARLKAAEVTQSQDGGEGVSISREITRQESDPDDLEPESVQERTEMIRIVTEDAAQVDEVVADITAELHEMESEFDAVKAQADRIHEAFATTNEAFHALESVGSRLRSYAAAEEEYHDRWEHEWAAIVDKLEEMDELRLFYDGYASAYDTLILEAERRRVVEEKIRTVWRKARDSVEKLVENDQRERDTFRQEIGEYLPTDLWVGMSAPLRRWDIVPVEEAVDAAQGETKGDASSALDKSVLSNAKERLGRAGGPK